MTLKNSYSNYFRNTLKRKSWLTALSSLAFFLTLTLPSLMIMGSKDTIAINNVIGEDSVVLFKEICGSLTGLMNQFGIFVKIAFVLLAIIAGITAFSYLHSKAKVDFYNSFSISRRALFLCNFLASILPILIGFAVNFILTHILIASFGYGQALINATIWLALAENILFFICIFSASALCAILCGNTVITLILAAVVFLGHSAISVLWRVLNLTLYPVYYMDSNVSLLQAIQMTPIFQIFNSYGGGYALTSRGVIFAIYFVVTAIVIAISFFCFLARKSEHAGVAIAFDKLKLPLKLYCCIIFALGFGCIFHELVSEVIWVYFGVIFGICLAHAISEITFNFSFNAIFNHWKQGCTLLAISLCIVAGMTFDVTGFNTRTVSANEVKSFALNMGADIDNGNSNSTLDSPENIEVITQIIKKASVFDRESGSPSIYFDVMVKKSPLGNFKRSYFVESTPEVVALFHRIRYSEEYKKAHSDLFRDGIEKATNITFKFGEVKSDDDIMLLTGDRLQAALQAMREDHLNLTAKEGMTPLYLAEFTIEDVLNPRTRRKWRVPIYKSYTKTLTLLEEYGDIPKNKLTADNIEKIDIDSSTINFITDSELYDANQKMAPIISYTDKTDIENLIQNAVSSSVRQYIERIEIHDLDCEIVIYFKDETVPSYYIIPQKNILSVID